ncbi:MAG TPA: hypothetical protein VIO94_15460 [Phenylobacterium sp.]
MVLPLLAFIAFASGASTCKVINALENSDAGVTAEIIQAPTGVTAPEFTDALIAQEDVLPFTRFTSGGVDGPRPTVSISFATGKHEVVIYRRLHTAPDEPTKVCRVQSLSDRTIGRADVRATQWCYAQLGSSPIIPKPLVIR